MAEPLPEKTPGSRNLTPAPVGNSTTAALGVTTKDAGGASAGHDGGGGGSGGSNMVSRDDTAGMHGLIARWLRGESERLVVYMVADSTTALPADRARAVRALLHAVGVLAVFFRCGPWMVHHIHACCAKKQLSFS